MSAVTVSWWRIAIASAVGGLYAVMCVIPSFGWMSQITMKVGVMALMLLCAFGLEKSTIKQGIVFLALSFVFCGIVIAMVHGLGTGLMIIHGSAYYPVSAKVLVLTAAVVYVFTRTILARFTQHTGDELVPVQLSAGTKSTKILALRDTGNTLKDPMTNSEILVAEWQVLKALIPAELAKDLHEEAFLQPTVLFEHFTKVLSQRKWKLIPFHSVGNAGGMLLAMKCDQVIIGKQHINGGIVAFSPNKISDGGSYSALTGGKS